VSIRFGRSLLTALAALSGAAALFVLTTVYMDTVHDTVLIGVSCVAAFVFALAFQGSSGIAAIRATDRAVLGWGAAAGAVTFWAAPLLSLSQRASDAPSGADTLFLTATAWGVLCVVAASLVTVERPAPTAVAGAFAVAAGAAGMLASWESPSSFSPFAKFPTREGLMLLAGVLFAAGVLVLAGVVRRVGARLTLAIALGGAAAIGLVTSLPALFSAGTAVGPLIGCIYVGAAMAVFAWGWFTTTEKGGLSRASVALLGVPLGVMALTIIEGFRGVYGPSPVAWAAAIAGIATMVAGIAVVWLAEKWPGPAEGIEPARLRVPLVLAGSSTVLALVALATPALRARAEGGLTDYFAASWVMFGFESAAGWLPVAAGLLAVAAVVVAREDGPLVTWVPSAVASLVCVFATIPLMGTTLHTWNRWVPAEVQQTYGTEYSRLVVESQLDWVRVASMALIVASLIVLAVMMLRPAASGVTLKEASR